MVQLAVKENVRVAPTTPMAPLPSDQPVAMIELLRIEGEARSVASTHELAILIANEARKIVRTRQTFVCTPQANGRMSLLAVTGLPVIDRTVPLMQCIERTIGRLQDHCGLELVRDFKIGAYSAADDTTAQSYPLQYALWFPITYRSGAVVAGVFMARDEAWTANDRSIVDRLALTFSQSWYWLATTKKTASLAAFAPKTLTVIIAGLAVAAGFIPVPMTTLAPLSVAPQNPLVVTSPLDGVIQDIAVDGNKAVEVGQLLVKFNDTALRNRLAIAARDVDVAEARVKKSSLLAVYDLGGRHEMAIDRAELDVKRAERDFAQDVLNRTAVMADQAGVVIMGDKRDLVGKPVSVGEKILELADPGRVELIIDVPVGDANILQPGARVKAFLDSDPLHPRDAHVLRTDYQARVQENGTSAFRVVAGLDEHAGAPPRLGIRGTAQLFGDTVPLFYVLFRRPMSSLRQWIGQ